MKRFAICLMLLITAVANAANWYVRPSAQGSSKGTSWANAWSFTGIKQASLAQGDTVWLAGGTYPAGQLSFTTSGASDKPIRFYRATSSDSVATSSPGWEAAFDSQVILQNPGPVFT